MCIFPAMFPIVEPPASPALNLSRHPNLLCRNQSPCKYWRCLMLAQNCHAHGQRFFLKLPNVTLSKRERLQVYPGITRMVSLTQLRRHRKIDGLARAVCGHCGKFRSALRRMLTNPVIQRSSFSGTECNTPYNTYSIFRANISVYGGPRRLARPRMLFYVPLPY